MVANVILVIGGIGLFLLGMVLLTDGLKGLAGSALRRMLSRYTKTPTSGAAAGAVATAIVQSSSATTVTAVGFVGAGLLTFPQALGIIFGANIGTTITGWLVAILGFKLQIGEIVLPFVLLGALLRLYGHGKTRQLGLAIAGFGLLFFGIDAMQQGMVEFKGTFTPDDFPDDTWFGRFKLVLIGVAITLITQSSSAGVATALAAVQAGAISFPQAAAMVIGLDVGTTFTAALATVGGSTAIRRTGYAHVIYNVLTGIMAFLLLGPFSSAISGWISDGEIGNVQIALVAFHTFFNGIGVILILPFTGAFARLVTRLVPETGPVLVRHLDERFLADPRSATDAAAATIHDIAAELGQVVVDVFDVDRRMYSDFVRRNSIDEALEATNRYMAQIGTEQLDEPTRARHTATLHALDHLLRLSHRCSQEARIDAIRTDRQLCRLAAVLRKSVIKFSLEQDLETVEKKFDRLREFMRRQRRRYRKRTVKLTSQKESDIELMLHNLDGVRWLHRVSYHLWRIVHHLRRAKQEQEPELLVHEISLEQANDD